MKGQWLPSLPPTRLWHTPSLGAQQPADAGFWLASCRVQQSSMPLCFPCSANKHPAATCSKVASWQPTNYRGLLSTLLLQLFSSFLPTRQHPAAGRSGLPGGGQDSHEVDVTSRAPSQVASRRWLLATYELHSRKSIRQATCLTELVPSTPSWTNPYSFTIIPSPSHLRSATIHHP